MEEVGRCRVGTDGDSLVELQVHGVLPNLLQCEQALHTHSSVLSHRSPLHVFGGLK